MAIKRKYIAWVISFAIIAAISWLLFKSTSKPKLKVQNIVLIKLPSNRLRFQVKINTSKPCDAVIQYWIKGGGDTLFTAVSKSTNTHQLFITASKGRTHYQFRVKIKDGDEKSNSNIYSFVTQPIYQATPYFTLEQFDSSLRDELKDKFFLTQILTEPGSVVIIDNEGEIVWYEAFQKGVKVSNWTKDRTVLSIVGAEKIPSSGGDEIIELALDGTIVTHLEKGKQMDKLVHHEVRKDNEDNIYALTFTEKFVDLSPVGGNKHDTVHGDGIVIFNKAGKKIWEWSVLDHLNPFSDPMILKNKKDWVHANSLFRLEDGNFLLSFRDLDQVWKIEFKSGKVLWKLGSKGAFKMNQESNFTAQHYAHPIDKEKLMLLDNGEKNKISRALIFKLDTVNKRAEAITTVTLPAEYYTTAKGSAALFGKDSNKVLFCLTDPRALLITDFKGKILWKVQVGGDPYRLEEIRNFLNVNAEF